MLQAITKLTIAALACSSAANVPQPQMKPDVLRALYTAHDENAEFYIHYRSGCDGVERPFKYFGSDAKFKHGDFIRAAMWASAPSALDQIRNPK